MSKSFPPTRDCAAFTLVELLSSMALLLILMVLLLSMVEQTSKIWRQTTGRAETFREARLGFESMTRQISQATLNTYWDYFDAAGNPRNVNATDFVPAQYKRQSELRFISGFESGPTGLIKVTNSDSTQSTPPLRPGHAVFFQAPLGYTESPQYVGQENLLNTWGYYVEYTSDTGLKPKFIKKPKNRFRLMELMEPSEALTLYSLTSGKPGLKSTDPQGMDWFRIPLAGTTPVRTRMMAENVVALVILPKLSKQDEEAGAGILSPSYSYDSTTSNSDPALNPKNQLPPVVQISLIAIDESSAGRLSAFAAPDQVLGLQASATPRLFAKADQYDADLTTLKTNLLGRRLSYRIFSTSVPIRSAKWSTEQAQ